MVSLNGAPAKLLGKPGAVSETTYQSQSQSPAFP
jgi:hypothetical protein